MSRPLHVLLLEDDPDVRRTFERQAQRNPGVELVATGDVDAARAAMAAADTPFDLLVSDFQLRGGITSETSASFVEEMARAHMPTLVMTGVMAPAVEALAGVVPVLAKPLVLRDVIAAYERHYDTFEN